MGDLKFTGKMVTGVESDLFSLLVQYYYFFFIDYLDSRFSREQISSMFIYVLNYGARTNTSCYPEHGRRRSDSKEHRDLFKLGTDERQVLSTDKKRLRARDR